MADDVKDLPYWISRSLLKLAIRAYFRFEVVGAENLPKHGPVVLCSNHRSYWDPPMVGSALPRKVYFMAKEELFRVPLFKYWLYAVGAFPVRRHTVDRASLKQALSLLKAGEVVAVFPEGRRVREGEEGEAYAGAAMLALSAGAPVVPMAIAGDPRPFSRVRVTIGEPIDLREHGGDRRQRGRDLQEIVKNVVMARIRALAEAPSSGRQSDT